IKVWDIAVRLFHWAIVVLIVLAWGTQEFDQMDWHVWIGYTILALLLFRIAWGFIGSDTARFSRFLRSPASAFRHLAHIGRREADREIGHNAAGGWMVLVMLVLIGVQAGTGLFANDDGDTEGPLMHFVSKEQSDFLSKIHSINFTLIEATIVLHVLAIGVYAILKRQNLVRPMILGTKPMPPGTVAPRLASPLLALLTLAAAAGIVTWLVWL
ncbi:MAG TPA: cytochrome b/b6 domain-containing protein, partial [Rhodopila sp.]|nr:cytochrome b/b6 domain-containing protein [Rhodopila sp.]